MVERNDQCQAAVRIVRPVVEFFARSLFSGVGEPGDDLLVRSSTHPPLPVFAVGSRIEIRPEPLREEEIEDARPFGGVG